MKHCCTLDVAVCFPAWRKHVAPPDSHNASCLPPHWQQRYCSVSLLVTRWSPAVSREPVSSSAARAGTSPSTETSPAQRSSRAPETVAGSGVFMFAAGLDSSSLFIWGERFYRLPHTEIVLMRCSTEVRVISSAAASCSRARRTARLNTLTSLFLSDLIKPMQGVRNLLHFSVSHLDSVINVSGQFKRSLI